MRVAWRICWDVRRLEDGWTEGFERRMGVERDIDSYVVEERGVRSLSVVVLHGLPFWGPVKIIYILVLEPFQSLDFRSDLVLHLPNASCIQLTCRSTMWVR